jgi:dTDP-4-dehydrorhamnose reductase
MSVLITGANGMLARAAATHCRSLGDDVVALTHSDLDISDRDEVFSTFERILPTIVLNCAAYTNVDGAEANVEQCYAANATGVENLAAASREFGAVFVTVSTDYVFDGERDGFYSEGDVPNPLGVYAKSKYEGELRSAAANPDAIIARSGWIYGRFGTNFLSVMRDLLASGKEITAIADSFGTPTYASDLAVRLRELAEWKGKGVFHVANDGPGTSFFEFAGAVATIGGFDPGLIRPVSKDSLDRPAPRPVNSRLASVRLGQLGLQPLRDWKDALSEHLSLANENAKGGK